mmetsp:Transcript_20825/g.52962  ORF Transcript_20825/g.52962 Transcript_20825/m.52962 type:complete len:226 (-) Transcript_20825:389-1066(-)
MGERSNTAKSARSPGLSAPTQSSRLAARAACSVWPASDHSSRARAASHCSRPLHAGCAAARGPDAAPPSGATRYAATYTLPTRSRSTTGQSVAMPMSTPRSRNTSKGYACLGPPRLPPSRLSSSGASAARCSGLGVVVMRAAASLAAVSLPAMCCACSMRWRGGGVASALAGSCRCALAACTEANTSATSSTERSPMACTATCRPAASAPATSSRSSASPIMRVP